MVDHQFAADSVLDIGCGTGALLHWAREAGHTGRFAFETRNPAARVWERWTPEHAREAGFTVEQQFGDWDRSPLSATAPELVAIARCA